MSYDSISLILRGLIAALAGLWRAVPHLTQLLVILMVADTILGIIVAIKTRQLSATRAWDGALRKVVALILTGVAAVLDLYIGASAFGLLSAASMFYCLTELISITRNAAILEVPVFTQMKDVLRYFQEQVPQEKEDE